uniref:carnosine N-methyltransferase n=1 Tax=Entomoneis paludosa TaxID=265537 RepID=A0A7S2VE53_9STRA|mmetsp:Transcript_18627/g.38478  ORF Transcript_18627/g.38478 Transcript_18627/m.38478 type:complete len:625 (+) Transcript_18627:224-2098(+)
MDHHVHLPPGHHHDHQESSLATSCSSNAGVNEAMPPKSDDGKNGTSNSNANSRDGYHCLSHAYSTYLAHDTQEQMHWEDVCRSYRQYATFAMAQWANHQYRLHALTEDQRRFLPPALRRETPEFQQRAKLFKDAAIRNQFCLDCILRHAGQANSQDVLVATGNKKRANQIEHCSDAQISKVSSVLKSLARDWSAEGKAERDMAYAPILELVQRYLPIPSTQQPPKASSSTNGPTPTATVPRLCIPGAGVGRLACELAAKGYAVQGNEFSLYMLLASDFILNGGLASPQHPMQISPYLLESRNVHSAADPLRSVAIPGVDPFEMIMGPSASNENKNIEEGQPQDQEEEDENDEINEMLTEALTEEMETSFSAEIDCEKPDDAQADGNGSSEDSDKSKRKQDEAAAPDFSMAAGEFISIYGSPRERGKWNAFVACFFLDTAPCIIDYIRVMHSCLAPGGFVFHFGPLLWHYSGPAMRPDDKSWDSYQSRYSYLDPKYMSSMDLSWQDVRAIFENVGFEIVQEQVGVRALYTADQRSMMNMTYRCIQFVARKKGGPHLPLEMPSMVPLPGETPSAVADEPSPLPTPDDDDDMALLISSPMESLDEQLGKEDSDLSNSAEPLTDGGVP